MDPTYRKAYIDEACATAREMTDNRLPPVDDTLPSNLRHAMLEVFRGLKTTHKGYILHNTTTQDRGIRQLIAGMKTIDLESTGGRDIFLPFLEDEDPDIVVAAAGALLQSKPGLAKKHLRHIHRTCVSEASFTAMNILFFKGNGFNMGPPDPRFPKPDLPPGNEWLDDKEI